VLLELSHRLPGDIPVPSGLEQPEVGLLDPEAHLGADVGEIRTEGVAAELLDLHLGLGPAEVVEILAE
jgi:hypothetical protein